MEPLPSYSEENVNKIVYLFDKAFPSKIKLSYVGELIDVLRHIGKYSPELDLDLFNSLSSRILKNFQIVDPTKEEIANFYFLPDEILEEMCSEINLLCVSHKSEVHELFQRKIDELEPYVKKYYSLEKLYYKSF